MTWNPELQPAVSSTDETKMEWLVRSFRKLGQWSSTRVAAGYGGLYLSAASTLTPAVTLTTTFQKLVAFDRVTAEQPIDVTQDIANSTISVDGAGMWVYEFAAVGEIVPFSSNAAQTIEVAAYNEAKGTSIIVGYHPVPRYSDVFDIGLTGMRPAPGPFALVELGDPFSLWIRQRAATPQITVNTIQEMEISAFRVSA